MDLYDLEPLNTECIWIEIHLNHTRILFGLFYRPPNSDMAYFSRIEDSILLALDTQIRNIIVTGDFNFNMLSDQTSKKVTDICEQFSLYQTITEPTHFTENSSSLIDIILTSDKNNLIYSGVTDPFLSQETRITAQFMASLSLLNIKENPFPDGFGDMNKVITIP